MSYEDIPSPYAPLEKMDIIERGLPLSKSQNGEPLCITSTNSVGLELSLYYKNSHLSE